MLPNRFSQTQPSPAHLHATAPVTEGIRRNTETFNFLSIPRASLGTHFSPHPLRTFPCSPGTVLMCPATRFEDGKENKLLRSSRLMARRMVSGAAPRACPSPPISPPSCALLPSFSKSPQYQLNGWPRNRSAQQLTSTHVERR